MVKDLNDPTNRDTVPAMLTPGEFVLNKEAAAMYGPIIEKMNNHGLQQRHAENQVVQANMGKKISKLHGEGYTAPGQAYAIAKSMGYNQGGLVASIKQEEGFRNKAYQDPGGVWTIGYGRTTNPDGSRIRPGQTTSRAAEDDWIVKRVDQERAAVKAFGEQYGYDWNQNQIDALASFRYNGGQGMLEKLTRKGGRDNDAIAAKMLQYNKQRIDGKLTELPGLTKRRKNEAALFSGNAPASPAPQQAQAEVPPEAAPPVQQAEAAPPEPDRFELPRGQGFVADEEEDEVVPSLSSELGQMALESAFQQSAPIQHATSRQFTQPEYIPLSAQKKKEPQMQRLFNNGGWLDWRGLDGRGMTLGQKLGQGVLWGRDDDEEDLPVPGSDESLLQFSSDQQQEIAALPIGDPKRVAAIESGKFIPTEGDMAWEEQKWRTNNELQTAQLQAAVTAPDAPGAQFIQNRVTALQDQASSLGVPPESQGVGAQVNVGGPDVPPQLGDVPGLGSMPNEVGAVPGLTIGEAPLPQEVIDSNPEDIWGGMDALTVGPGEEFQAEEQAIATGAQDADPNVRPNVPSIQQPGSEAGPNFDKTTPEQNTVIKQGVEEVINTQGETPPLDADFNTVEQAGQSAPKETVNKAKGWLKEAFGELFNGKELARAAILMAGGMATGMTPGQALSFAGGNYLQRIDALAANQSKTKQELIKGGKYTTQSIEAYMESGDASVLMPTDPEEGAGWEETGQIKDFYSETGKTTARQIKVGDNKIWVDQNNKPINVHKFNEDPSNVRGTPEYRTRITQSMKTVEDSLKDLKQQFGVRGESRDGTTQYATDVVPSVQAGKIAEWAVKNGVRPEEVAGLVESAYHDAINDRRQDGARVRDLTPYLNQLVIRQSVGAGSDVFRINAGEDGPPQYIDTKKMTVLNSTVSDLLRRKGFKGGSQDLANQFYTAGISDWNKLSPDAQKEWNRKANKGENGFYHYLTSRINSYL